MVAFTKPQKRKKEERKRLRGERDQSKFTSVLNSPPFKVFLCTCS